jgi:hypothetical protein
MCSSSNVPMLVIVVYLQNDAMHWTCVNDGRVPRIKGGLIAWWQLCKLWSTVVRVVFFHHPVCALFKFGNYKLGDLLLFLLVFIHADHGRKCMEMTLF